MGFGKKAGPKGAKKAIIMGANDDGPAMSDAHRVPSRSELSVITRSTQQSFIFFTKLRCLFFQFVVELNFV